MSFAMTTPQIRARTKTVTRRMGWRLAKAGMVVQAVEKSQGLKKGEKVKPLALIRFTDVRCEPLSRMTENANYGESEVVKEGFPDYTPEGFVAMFCEKAKCDWNTYVMRLEFEYVESKSIGKETT